MIKHIYGIPVIVTMTLGVFYGLLQFFEFAYTDAAVTTMLVTMAIASVMAFATIPMKAPMSITVALSSFTVLSITVTIFATLVLVFSEFSPIIAAMPIMLAANAAFLIEDHTCLSWKQCFSLYLMISISIGGSMYLRLIEMSSASYAVAIISIIMIYLYGMSLASVEEKQIEVPV